MISRSKRVNVQLSSPVLSRTMTTALGTTLSMDETRLIGNLAPKKPAALTPVQRMKIMNLKEEIDPLSSHCLNSYFRGDHTYNNSIGVFLFIEASYPADVGFQAKLESTLFQPTPSYGVCMVCARI